MSKLSLAIDLSRLRLRNPVMLSAGILGLSAPLLKRVYESGAGAVVTKSIGPNPRQGHPNPTVVAREYGLLNSMGLPNPGVDVFSEEVRSLKGYGVTVVASIFGESIEEY
ncbi:MAG: dihydroorotate dehydrogenase, partial [Candidatus Bathyarchaeia archaeon]